MRIVAGRGSWRNGRVGEEGVVEERAFEDGVDQEVEQVPGVKEEMFTWCRPWKEMPGDENGDEKESE